MMTDDPARTPTFLTRVPVLLFLTTFFLLSPRTGAYSTHPGLRTVLGPTVRLDTGNGTPPFSCTPGCCLGVCHTPGIPAPVPWIFNG